MSEQLAKTKGFSLYPKHEAIIEKAMSALRRKNQSDTLQFIIEDWDKLKAELEGFQLAPTAPQNHKATR